MNFGHATWYLTSSACTTFDDLFEKFLTYEDLWRIAGIAKTTRASIYVVSNYSRGNYNKGYKTHKPHREQPGPHDQTRGRGDAS